MRVRLASFNVENLSEDEQDRRIAALRPLLLDLDADILCLQEVNASAGKPAVRRLAGLDAVIAGTPYAGHERVTTLNDHGTGPRDIQNLVILSRYPIRRWAQVRHDLVPPITWPALTATPPQTLTLGFDRPILHVVIDLGGRRLDLFNLHLRAPLPAYVPGRKRAAFAWDGADAFAEGCFLAEIKRAGQALEARLLVERRFNEDPDALIAVVGDYNAGLSDLTTQMIRAAPIDTGNPNLAARALVPLEARLAPARRHTVRHGGQAIALDHMLVSPPLAATCTAVAIHNDDLTDELVDWALHAHRGSSHHAPVVAEFEL